jgi:hypothetical protein
MLVAKCLTPGSKTDSFTVVWMPQWRLVSAGKNQINQRVKSILALIAKIGTRLAVIQTDIHESRFAWA